MTVKYVLCPGHVKSQTDGDTHYIDAGRLAFLYGVPMSECTVWPRYYMSESGWKAWLEQVKDLPRLRPRYDGNYTLPKKVSIA